VLTYAHSTKVEVLTYAHSTKVEVLTYAHRWQNVNFLERCEAVALTPCLSGFSNYFCTHFHAQLSKHIFTL
jgi:hypothetical protein